MQKIELRNDAVDIKLLRLEITPRGGSGGNRQQGNRRLLVRLSTVVWSTRQRAAKAGFRGRPINQWWGRTWCQGKITGKTAVHHVQRPSRPGTARRSSGRIGNSAVTAKISGTAENYRQAAQGRKFYVGSPAATELSLCDRIPPLR